MFSGRLDFQDITEDGFYAAERSSWKFVLLDEYFQNFYCPVTPLYVANFEMPISQNVGEGSETEYSSIKSDQQPTSNFKMDN